MDSQTFAGPVIGIFCSGLNAYCMQTRPLFLRISGSSGVLKAFLLERNRQLSCNPKKKKKKKITCCHPCTFASAGDAVYPTTNMFSIFSVKCGMDCPTAWLGQHKLWAIACKSDWYAFALERGTKERQLRMDPCTRCHAMSHLHYERCLCTIVGVIEDLSQLSC